MAFRRRGMRPRRTFGRRRQGGSRWADAGRKAGVVRARREWTGFFDYPGCGDLDYVTFTPDGSECYAQFFLQVLPVGPLGSAGDDQESTILALRGSIECWVHVGAPSGVNGPAYGAVFGTGIGWGLQLVPFRGGGTNEGGAATIIRNWVDCDNSDWLFRRWYPAQSEGTTLIQDASTGQRYMLVGDEQSRQIDVTRRKVDWSEWALMASWVVPVSDEPDSDTWLTRLNLRLLEKYTGGNSAVG